MTAWLDDLRTHLQLALGSATLLLLIAEHDAVLDETRRLIVDLLRGTPLAVADLGAISLDAGPRRWAELTKGHAEDVVVLSAAPPTPLSLNAMVRLYNAERELLRQLEAPVVLVISSATEKATREQAPDFFTWAARTYALPSKGELTALAKQLGVAPAIVEPPAPEEEPIRFLHISDIHLRPQLVKRYDQDRVLRGLVDLLTHDRQEFPLDLIFVTGDLANGGKADEYLLVVELLKRLMEVTGVPPEHVFVVPGNHDVDRDVGRWLLRTLGKDEESIAFFEDAKNRAFHLKKLEAYAESMRALLGKERPLGLAVGEEAVEIVEVRGSRLAVASFNSAWFAQGDDDRGKLWLGEPNVNRAGQRVADLEAPFAVALLHHPLDDLHESERDDVEHYFERSFDVVMRGHLHKDKTRAIATQRGGYVEVAGAAAYQGSQWPNGCFLGEIWTRARKVRLRPYAYASPTDGWVLDTKVFPDDWRNGYRHTFKAAKKQRLKSAIVKQREQVVEDLVRAASPTQQRMIAAELGIATQEGESARNVVQQTARSARARVGAPIDLQRIVGSVGPRELGLVLATTMIGELREESPRVSTSDQDFLERALLIVGRAFSRTRDTLGSISIPASVAVTGIYAALGAILDPPTMAQAQDAIFLGSADKACVIHVTHTRAAGLAAIDQYLSTGHYIRGALVFLEAHSRTETEPLLEHATTPAGHDVLLLRL
jgi:calcineurin-like phosphoesterase family protein